MIGVESLLAMLILVVIWRAHRLETRLADAADRQFKQHQELGNDLQALGHELAFVIKDLERNESAL
jgi:hypothetical protein